MYTRNGEGLGLRALLAMNFSSGGRGPSACPLASRDDETSVHEASRATFTLPGEQSGSSKDGVNPPSHPTEQSRTSRSAIASSNSARRDACFCSVRQPKLKIHVFVSAAPVGPISNSSDDLNSGEREFSSPDELVCNMDLRLSIDSLLPPRALNRDRSHGSGTAPGDGEAAPSDVGQQTTPPVLHP